VLPFIFLIISKLIFPANIAAWTLFRIAVCQPTGCGAGEGRQAKMPSQNSCWGETDFLDRNSEGQSKETMNHTKLDLYRRFWLRSFLEKTSHKIRTLEESESVSSEVRSESSGAGLQAQLFKSR
jgi:hypothetical protein